MKYENTHVAGRRAESASCSQYKMEKDFSRPLNTQHAEEVKLLQVQFFSEEEK